MSDGPHRSLPMRPWWKRLAERADKCAFSLDEVAEALVPALEAECRKEMAPDFLDGLRGAVTGPSLFGPIGLFSGIDGVTASGFERRVLDHVAVLSPAETADVDCIQRALENAIRGETQRYFRQIEEHYLRKSSSNRARRERDRLDEALDRTNIRTVAEKLLKRGGPTGTTRVSIKSGLDDGVKLR